MERLGRIWLILSALVCSILLELAICCLLEFHLQREQATAEGRDNDFSPFSSNSPVLWTRTESSREMATEEESLFGRHSAARGHGTNDRRTRSSTKWDLESGRRDDVWKVSFNSVGFIRESNRGSGRSSHSRGLLQQSSETSCPVDFKFMRQFPSYVDSCRDFDPQQGGACCSALNSSIGQAWSQYLRISGQFRLKDVATVAACFKNLSAELQAEDSSLSTMIVPTCFPESNYSDFVSSPSNCEGIETRADFERLVGQATINSTLNQSCSSSSIIQYSPCLLCVNAISTVYTELSARGPNHTDCSRYTLFYAAGISNLNGPYDPAAASCILATDIQSSTQGSSKDLALPIGVGAAAAFVVSGIAFIVFFLWWRRRKGAARRAFIERNTGLLRPAMMRPNAGLINFSFEEIRAATNNFSAKNYIGSGGFGDVYHGLLDDGLEVAVKRMKNCSTDGDADFINEVNVINSVRHRNLVILRGCCVASTEADGHQRLLIYDYMTNGSLQDYLFGTKARNKPVMKWSDRKRLAIGIAKGIAYLHNDARPAIIHRDIKAANVLLDEDLNAKVADFGLAKFSSEGQSLVESVVAGTLGYVAPEYALYGQLTDKSDVYSFGVVLLELLSGRSAIEGVLGQSSLITDWAWGIVKEGNVIDIVDEKIRNEAPRETVERFVLVGILCSHMLVAFRPTMEEALRYLEGDSPLPDIPNRPLPINMGLPWERHSPPRAPSPGPSPPPANTAAALDALSDGKESEAARLYRIHVAAMKEFSGNSAGVNTESLLR